MIRSVSLLRIRKEWIQQAVTGNSFKTLSSCLTTLLIFTAIFELEAWIKQFIRFIGMVKSLYERDLHCSSLQRQIETKLLHKFAGASCNIYFYFPSSYSISRLIFKHYPWANRPEKNERSANLQHHQQPRYSFSWKLTKNNPLLDTAFFLTKNPNDPISDFS